MKISIFLFFFSLCLTLAAIGQNVQNKVVYECKTQIVKGKQHDGKNTLYFDNEKSLFIHTDWPKRDSSYMSGDLFFFIKGDTSKMPVYIFQKDSMIYYKSDYKSSNTKPCLMLQEKKPVIAWQIQAEYTHKIANFNCIKAVGTFGNRIYDVWFTPDVPINFGPYKLGGLPGLILEAKSRDGKVYYNFISYESNINKPTEIVKPKKFMTPSQFKSYVINSLLETESMSTANAKVTNDDPVSDYDIEKDKITIHRDYKKSRKSRD